MEESNAGVETHEAGSDLNLGVEIEDSLGSGESEDSTDWKAIAEKAQTEAENYKKALSQKRQFRNKAPDSEEVLDEDDDNKPLTRGEMRQMLQEEVIPVVAQSKVDLALTSMVKDPEKRKLVKLYYETRIRQTGTSDEAIRSDVQAALAIADSHKLRKAATEIDRANNNERPLPTNGTGADRGLPSREHGFSKDQVTQLTQRAQSLNQDPKEFIKKAWENANRR